MQTLSILGIPFNTLTENETLRLLQSFLDENHNRIVTTPNPEAVMQARRNAAFKTALLKADLCLPDGIGILLASRIQKGKRITERVRGVDVCRLLFQIVSKNNRQTTVYFLGGAPGVALSAKTAVENEYSSIQVVGTHDGFFSPSEEESIINEIKSLQPEILLVCMGMPRQEIWAETNRDLPVKLTLCLGGTLDILAGTVTLTPAWIRKIGLEWLHRLFRQPSRARRMLDLPRFVMAVLAEYVQM